MVFKGGRGVLIQEGKKISPNYEAYSGNFTFSSPIEL